jgi:hypothetical protein
MKRRAICVGGALTALTLVSLLAFAQVNANAQNNQNPNGDYGPNFSDPSVPFTPSADEIWALRKMANAGINDHDIMVVLPLLQDLRESEADYYARNSADMYNILASTDMSAAAGNNDLSVARQAFRDKREGIWNVIRQRIGDQKGSTLESMVVPMPQTISMAYTDGTLQQIDSLLAQWDTEEQARLAMIQNGTNGATNAVVTTAPAATNAVITTTTTTTTSVAPMTIYSFPPLTTAELVTMLQNRLAFVHGNEETALQLRPGERLTSEKLDHFKQRRLEVWR